MKPQLITVLLIAAPVAAQAEPNPGPPLLGHKHYFGESEDSPWVWRVALNWHEAQDITFESMTARDGANLVTYTTGTYSLQPAVDGVRATNRQFAPVAVNGDTVDAGPPQTIFFDWSEFPRQLEMWGLAFAYNGMASTQPVTTLMLIPEPPSCWIILLGLPVLLCCRRRKARRDDA